MPQQRLSDIQIAARIVPTHLRWPHRGTTTAWNAAHASVDALKELVRNVDIACAEVEQDRELSAGAIARQRAEICDRALIQLANFRSSEVAERALSEGIGSLEKLSYRDQHQVQMHQKLMKALADLHEGVEATKRLVRERCKMRENTFV